MWRCLRTSSALEGYHKHLRMLMEAAWGASEEWLDTISNLFDFRWIVDAGRVVGIYSRDVPHYDFEMLDRLDDAIRALPFKNGGGLLNHRVVREEEIILHHGAHHSREALKQWGEEGGGEDAGGNEDGPGGGGGGGAPIRVQSWRVKPTAEDVTALLKSGKLGNAAELTLFARNRRLLFGDGHAEKFLAGIATNEAMLLELAHHNFPALHSRLRVPVTGHSLVAAPVTTLPPTKNTAPASLAAPMSVVRTGASMARSQALPSVAAAASVALPLGAAEASVVVRRASGGGDGGGAGGGGAGGGGGGGGNGGGQPRPYRGARVATLTAAYSREKADEYAANKRRKRAQDKERDETMAPKKKAKNKTKTKKKRKRPPPAAPGPDADKAPMRTASRMQEVWGSMPRHPENGWT